MAFEAHDFPPGRLSPPDERPRPAPAWPCFERSDVEQSIPSRFAQQVAEHRDRVAVQDRSGPWTYGELNAAANRVARDLLAQGGAGEGPVAVLVEAGAPGIAAILGTLQAGKVCVPLDPRYPRDRLGYIVADSRAGLIATDGRNLHLARELARHGPRLVAADAGRAAPAAGDLALPIVPGAIALILYTSGSTGRPKGIPHSHRNWLRNIMGYTNALRIRPADRLTLLHSLSFSSGVADLLNALLNGAATLPNDPREEGWAALADWLARERITVLSWAPTPFRQFLGTLPAGATFPGIRVVLMGSEPLRWADVECARRHFARDGLLINRLGTTETLNYRFLPIDAAAPLGRGVVPGGYAVDGQEILLLDEAGAEVGPDVVGEIAVRSRYLSPGYLGRPDLDAAVFRDDPAGSGARIYRSGDLGLLRPDGCLEFHGRRDFQVKIRGHRVEVAEVEAALAGHAGIKEAAVAAREDRPGDHRLVAYIVAAGRPPHAGELRGHLAATLPDFMIPSAFVVIDALPLTPSGKLDRRALPAPGHGRPDLGQPFEAPRSTLEAALAAIWAEVLGLDRVGIRDPFADLGGHSLQAAQVVARVRDAFGVDAGLRRFFEAPTVADQALAVNEALATGHGPGGAGGPIARRGDPGPCPLSFAQQRLWFLDRLEPEGSLYNIPRAIRLRGRFDVSALGMSLDAIVARHEALRTTFTAEDGEPSQRVAAARAVPLPVLDLGGDADEGREARLRGAIAREVGRPFRLDRDLMLRAALLRLGVEEHVLLLVTHHIASDGWSMGVFSRELAAHYRAFVSGQAPALPDLPIQYADFALWQRRWLRGAALGDQLAYWSRALEGAPGTTELPTDHPRPATRSHRGALHTSALDAGLADALRALGRREGATLFMTLLAAFKVLICRYSGQEDLVVGAPIANRSRVEVEPLIGFFANTIALRTDLAGDPSFREVLARVRESTLDAYARQDLPFEKLVEELRPDRDLGRSPFFQVMFALQNAPRVPFALPGLEAEPLDVDPGTSKFDLILFVTEAAEGLACTLEYSVDLFEPTTIARLFGHYRTLLEAAASDPDRPISALPLLTEPERRQVLDQWNATATDYPRDATIHRLFEAQAARTPGAVALVAGDATLTYGELDARANRLAHHLRARGVAPGRLVGLCLERSPELIVGMLGILKAGGAYVPLDPDDPRGRLAEVWGDAGVALAVTRAGLRDRLPDLAAAPVYLDEGGTSPDGADPGPPADATTAEGLAYVMYTSGSTGRPKGVAVPHRGVVRLLCGVDYVRLEHGPTVLHMAPPAFDASTFEVWAPLLHGGRCVLVAGRVPTAADLGCAIERHGVNTLWLTAALFNAVIDEAAWALAGVRQLLIGGEALSVPHVRRALEHLPATRIINGYGPTESTTFACCYPIPRKLDERRASIPIGRPIANTRAYVLDGRREPVPIGVPGELYLGGDGLARGYLGHPELTAGAFVPDPFGAAAGARLYRTGDRARWHPDGTLEYLGRLDQQVKIRGFRIEPGEVEAVLSRHPDVRQAAVLVREDGPAGRRLVGYIVPGGGRTPAPDDLHGFLAGSLPEAMIPSAFVALEALPRTPHGKVDRRALAAVEVARGGPAGFVAPRDDAEAALARIWEELFGIAPIGAGDDFFGLGGHSLLAVRLVARLESTFGVRLPVAALFRAPTLGRLAAVVRDGLGADDRSRVVEIQPGDVTTPPFYCAPGGGTHGLSLRALADRLGPEQRFLGLEFDAVGREAGARPVVEEMAAGLVGDLCRAHPRGPFHLGGYSFGGLVAYEIARQLRERGRDVALLALLDTSGPGYPRRLSRLERERRHLAALRRLEPSGRAQYLLGRLRGSAGRLVRRPASAQAAGDRSEPFRRASRDYLARIRPYDGRIVLFRATESPAVLSVSYDDPCNGWGRVAASVEVHPIRCGHHELFVEPGLGHLACALRACLRSARTTSNSTSFPVGLAVQS